MKKFELLSATALAMFAASPAVAQTAAPEEVTASDGGNEIIVTAEKRAKTLQSTPISVAVTSSETVSRAGVKDLKDLQSLVPSLKIPQFQSASQTNFVIRGFGNGANNIGIESSVGVFVDGVYRSRSASAIADLPEIERVEVLRGPQSTLFGKNVSAGAISIITKKPQFKWGLRAEGTAGNYGQIRAGLTVNAPIGETLAVRLSGNFDTREGYFTNTNIGGRVNDRNRYSLRADLLFEPSDNMSFRLIGDYNHINEVCCGAVPIFNAGVTQFIGAPKPAGLGAAIGNTNRIFNYELAYDENPRNTLTGKGVSLQGDFSLGFAKLTSITAYRSQKDSNNLDVDFTGAKIVTQLNSSKIDTFSQEIRLTSESNGPFTWLIGGFYADETIRSGEDIRWGPDARPFVTRLTSSLLPLIEGLQAAIGQAVPGKSYIQPGQGVLSAYRLDDRSYSLFGQANYKMFDKLTVTGGLAYLSDRKKAQANSVSNDTFARLNLDNLSFGPIPIAALPNAPLSPTLTLQQLAVSLAGPGGSLASPIPVNLFSVLGLKPIQFFRQPVNYPNAAEDGILAGNKLTYMGRLAYDFSRRLSVYASYSKGWKAGAYNLSRDSRPPNALGIGRSAGPEDTTVYEIGVKGSFPGGYVNLAVFQQSIKGFQDNAFTGTGFNLVNAGKQSVKGFELDASYRPFTGLTLAGGVTYLDPKYNSFTKAACPSVVALDPARCGAGQQFRDLSGERPAGIATWSANLNGTYTANLGGGWNGFLRGEYVYASKTRISSTVPANLASVKVGTVNASIGIGNEDLFEVQLWVRNLNKDKYLQGAFNSVAQLGSYAGYPNEPRTFGATVRKTF